MGPLRAPPFVQVAPDRIVLRCPAPYPWYVQSDVCLARLSASGSFLLLSAAWEGLLGFAPRELDGRALLDLLTAERRAAGEASLRRLLSPAEADPVALELGRRDGTMLRMHCHRRFDPYDGTLFIAGEPAGITVARCRAPSARGPL